MTRLGYIWHRHTVVHPVDMQVQPPRAVQPQAQDSAFRTCVQVGPKLLTDLGGETDCLPEIRLQLPASSWPTPCDLGCSPWALLPALPAAGVLLPPSLSPISLSPQQDTGRDLNTHPLPSPFGPTVLPPRPALSAHHLEPIVEDATTAQQPGGPFEGAGRRREVEPLRGAGDDTQDKRRCPLPVQEVYPHLGEGTGLHPHFLGQRPSTQAGPKEQPGCCRHLKPCTGELAWPFTWGPAAASAWLAACSPWPPCRNEAEGPISRAHGSQAAPQPSSPSPLLPSSVCSGGLVGTNVQPPLWM